LLFIPFLCLFCCTTQNKKYPWFITKLYFDEVNDFNQVYTPKIGLLDSGLITKIIDSELLNIRYYSNIVDGEDTNINEHGSLVYYLSNMLCPNADYFIVRILNNGGFTDEDTIIQGLNILKNFDCDIINMSFGSTFNSEKIEECINSFNNRCLFISSIGDRSLNSFFYPSRYDRVIPVGATDQNDIHYALSNVDTLNALWFPGVDLSFNFYGNTYLKTGSSYASALATGYLALLESKNRLDINNLINLNCYTDGKLDVEKLITS